MQRPLSLLGTAARLIKTLRPISLVAERSGKSASTAYEEHGSVLTSYRTLDVQTGSTMLDQHPQYLGFAHPFTMPVAVGGTTFKARSGGGVQGAES